MPRTSFTSQITVRPLAVNPLDPGGPQIWPGCTPFGVDTAFDVVTEGTVVTGVAGVVVTMTVVGAGGVVAGV